ncbi:rRNA maturation RNase YbeY [Xanthobacter sp. KR7-65]|uniref:rRNA maturation RNase YbeY n=1 Tax=Xanthobacter sp. KR7-65 TaxID=3156612 RepID=UPI0032B51997
MPQAEAVAVKACEAALAALGEAVPVPCEVAITLTDDARIRVLNRDWRGMDKPTNVLSFPQPDLPEGADAPQPLGDIIVALQTLAAEAAAEGKAAENHLAHLVVHGTLHLMGYDHIEDHEAEEMEALEREILAGLGIADPYGLPQD